ncbi:MAG: CPBP family intramembrane metalloprotease [Lachnospiraceae bacterium]|nr:CPBP family intramembrane metalloprotease [Lachnospiraceae bacterium]
MTKKDSGIVFLIMILAELVLAGGLRLLVKLGLDVQMPAILSLILNQLILLVPVLIYLFVKKIPLKDVFRLRRIKVANIFLCIVYTLLCAPAMIFANLVTMLIAGNTAMELGSMLSGVSPIVIVLIVGILAPVNEEFMTRGVLNTGLRSTGRVVGAALLTGLCFGVMHLDLNQFSYAFIIGTMMVLVNEAADSIWPSIIFHICINFGNVVNLIANMSAVTQAGGDYKQILAPIAEQSGMTIEAMMAATIVVYAVLAVGGLTLAILLLFGIAGIEGRYKEFTAVFKKSNEKKESLWSPYMIIALFIGIIVIIAMLAYRF